MLYLLSIFVISFPPRTSRIFKRLNILIGCTTFCFFPLSLFFIHRKKKTKQKKFAKNCCVCFFHFENENNAISAILNGTIYFGCFSRLANYNDSKFSQGVKNADLGKAEKRKKEHSGAHQHCTLQTLKKLLKKQKQKMFT